MGGKQMAAFAFGFGFAFAFAFAFSLGNGIGQNSSKVVQGKEKEEAEAEAWSSSIDINVNVNATLSLDLYVNSCPEAEGIVFSWVQKAVSDDPRMAASLLRLHFHDCFVNGCDASVLLDDTGSMEGEKSAGPNANSLRGFEVIDAIKAEIEYFCPQTVSCADILAIAARDSVFLSGGPRWEVEMGRRDSLMGSKAAANTNIPAPNSDLPTLFSKFKNLGLSLKHLIALSGAHTIGKARCSTFSSRLNNNNNGGINNLELLQSLQQLCGNKAAVADLDYASPTRFDNEYYVNLVSGEGLLPSDQALLTTTTSSGLDEDDIYAVAGGLVESYANDVNLFFHDFAQSMLAMGALHNHNANASPGQIRRNCHFINS